MTGAPVVYVVRVGKMKSQILILVVELKKPGNANSVFFPVAYIYIGSRFFSRETVFSEQILKGELNKSILRNQIEEAELKVLDLANGDTESLALLSLANGSSQVASSAPSDSTRYAFIIA